MFYTNTVPIIRFVKKFMMYKNDCIYNRKFVNRKLNRLYIVIITMIETKKSLREKHHVIEVCSKIIIIINVQTHKRNQIVEL